MPLAFIPPLALIPPVALAGLALVLVGGWGFTVRRARLGRCARCGYPTRGLPSPVCPECGGDLRAQNLLTGSPCTVLRPPREVMILCRSFAAITFLMVALVVGVDRFPYGCSWANASAAGTADTSWRLTASARGSRPLLRGERQRVVRLPLRARLTGPEGSASLTVLDHLGRARYDGPAGPVTLKDGLNPHHVLEWMAAAGIDTSSDHAAAEAGALHTLLGNTVLSSENFDMPTGRGGLRTLASVRLSISNFYMPTPAYTAAAFCASFALWLAFIRGVPHDPARRG